MLLSLVQKDKQEAGQKVLAITAAGERGASAAAWSCLDGLWEALGRGAELRAGQPAVLAQAVRALLGMWQVQPPASLQLPYSPAQMPAEYEKCSRSFKCQSADHCRRQSIQGGAPLSRSMPSFKNP